MLKKIFGTISCIAGISAISFCSYILFTEEFDIYMLIPLGIILVSLSAVIYTLTTRFWRGSSLFEIKYKKILLIPLKIHGIVSSIAGLSGLIVITIAFLIKGTDKGEEESEYIVLFVAILSCFSIIYYPFITKFWSLKFTDIAIPKTVQYFKLTQSILLPIKTTKFLLFSIILLGFIHVSYCNEIRVAPPLNKVEIVYNSNRINNMQKKLKFFYFGYLVILSSLILSAKIIPVENVKETN